MLAVARERAAARNLTNIDFVHGDAQVQKFEPAVFDVAISRNGSMFFDDQVKAFANIASAMKPDASLVLLTWQGFTENDWLQQLRHIMAAGRDIPPPDPNKPGPFAFSDPDHIQNVLMSTGFAAVKCETLRRPLYFGVDVAAAEQLLHSQFAWMLEGLDIPTREQTLSQLHTDLAEHLTPEGVAYDSATWLVTAKRR
jgi:SAM-dependent methyltransferase